MFEADDVAYTIGENLLEVRMILTTTVTLLKSVTVDSDKEKTLVKESIDSILRMIEGGVLSQILERHSKLRTLDESYCDLGQNDESDESEIRPSKRARLTKEEVQIADLLKFPDRQTAISIRQAIFNIDSLLNRSCYFYIQHADLAEAEALLFKVRIGQMLGGPLWDILKDLFTAHPDLAICGYEKFNWHNCAGMNERGNASQRE